MLKLNLVKYNLVGIIELSLILDCKTVVFGFSEGAKRRKRDPRVSREPHTLAERVRRENFLVRGEIFLASLPILPRRFYTRSRPFEDDCFAVYANPGQL